jgi:hypothetical protein
MHSLRTACGVRLLFALPLMLAACTTPTRASKTSPAQAANPRGSNAEAVVQSKPIPMDVSIPERYRQKVMRAQAYGKLLYRQDLAAWVSSDAIVSRGLTKKYADAATGWIAEGQDVGGNLWNVAYTERRDSKSYAFADVIVDLGHGHPQIEVHENQPARALSQREEAVQALRIETLQGQWLRCAPRYNYATSFRVEDHQEWIVVDLLPSRAHENEYPLGGFHEFSYSLSKDTPARHFSQTKSCLSGNADAVTPDGSKLNGFIVSHLTSDTPTQFLVFLSLSYHKPLYVLTVGNHLFWSVDNGKIRMIEDTSQEKGGGAGG